METLATPNASNSSQSQRFKGDKPNFRLSTETKVHPKILSDSKYVSSKKSPTKRNLISRLSLNRPQNLKSKKITFKSEKSSSLLILNHLENHFNLSNKKGLFYNMKMYYDSLGQDVFDYLPLTFHVKEGTADKVFEKF